MQPYHIAITIDDNYIQHACVMLQSLHEHVKSVTYVHCIYDSLNNRNKDILTREFKNSRLNISFIKFNPEALPQLPIKQNDHVSAATFFRIWLPELLPQVKQVLFLDTDIIINGDISTLLKLDVSHYPIAAVPELAIGTPKKLTLGMHGSMAYFNAGIMVVNLDYFRQHNLTQQLTQFITTHPELCEFWDQDALNAVINGNFLELHARYNLQTSSYGFSNNEQVKQAIARPVIVHYTGGGSCKPWHYQNTHPLKHLYYKYLRKTPFRYSYPTQLPRSWRVFRKLHYIVVQTLPHTVQYNSLKSAIETISRSLSSMVYRGTSA